MSLVLYIASFRAPTPMLSVVGNAGLHIHDFFIGRELNPRIFGLDLKQFCELRPGMFLWVLVNYSYAVKQHVQTGISSFS
jgi:delta14-sterol reductase